MKLHFSLTYTALLKKHPILNNFKSSFIILKMYLFNKVDLLYTGLLPPPDSLSPAPAIVVTEDLSC